ncbi:MAG: AI-2E family transporter [Sulfuricurvum sp.]
MKPIYFLALLFALSLYLMYQLYAPFLLAMIIATLLAISTSNINEFFYNLTKHKLLSALASTTLLAVLFFVPLSYFLLSLSDMLRSMDPATLQSMKDSVVDKLQHPPEMLEFLRPALLDHLGELDLTAMGSNMISQAKMIGSLSLGFLKNAFLVVVFYFFVIYNSEHIFTFIKRVAQMGEEDSSTLIKELSSVMGVVFYSIIVNAMLQGILFGVMISLMGYNGLLFGVMYGFASLIPVVGGAMMWLPFGFFEYANGSTGGAIFIVSYSVVVISIIADTFLKPLIIKEINKRLLKNSDATVNELVIFFAILAGLSTFGFWGMILGPAITAFFLTLLRLFETRIKECS